MNVTVKNTVTTSLLVMIVLLITLLVLISIRPISLPFVSDYIRDQLDNRFHAYYIDFDNARTRWHPFKNKLEFHLDSVRALDYGNNNLATVPKVIVEIEASTVFDNFKKIRTIILQNPKISLVRSHGGALKFDIGSTHDGSSGRILETILIYVATAPTANSQNDLPATNFRIINSDLVIGDEITGSLLHAPDAHITLTPNNKGVSCAYEFNVFARGEYLNISGDWLYDTSEEKLNLLVSLHEVRPALLADFLPQLVYFAPLEVQLSGDIQMELDKYLVVDKATFDLTSKKGSLEIVELLGNNLAINSLHITGKALNRFSYIELDRLSLDLKENKVEANALFLKDNDNLDIKVNAFFKGNSISGLLPRWFAYLQTDDLSCLETIDNAYHHSSISIDGNYDLAQHKINALGQFKCHDIFLSNNDNNYSLDEYLNSATNTDLNFRVDGTLKAPNLATAQ